MHHLVSLLIRHSPWAAVLAALAGVTAGAANAGLLALVNTAMHQDRPWEDPYLVGGFVVLCLLLPGMHATSSYVLTRLGHRTTLKLRMELSRSILSAPLRQLETLGSPRVYAALTEDVIAIVAALSSLPLVFVQSTIVAGCMVYLGWLSWQVLVAVLLALTLGVVSYQIPMARGAAHHRRGREEADRLYEHFRAVTGGTKELKLHRRRREALLAELEATGKAVQRWLVRAYTLYSAAAGWGTLIVFGLVGTVVFVVPALGEVDLKTLTGYALILLFMMSPIEVLLSTMPHMARAQVSLQRIHKIGLSLGADAPAAAEAPPGDGEWRSLELSEVTHAYETDSEDGRFILGPLTLRFEPGQIVFITGGNGSGKTTLAKLITGLYRPESGELRMDGVPLSDAGSEAHLERFSTVFTDFFLFDRLLGLESPDMDARAAHYLERLRLDHKVRVRDGRLSSTDLSQGQRKRLALLTAYMEDRPIYLFDEWAADQDPAFKEFFYLELLPDLKRQGKTVLVISHDEHYYAVADRVVKLEEGQLEYDGPPGGLQYRIPRVQLPVSGPPLTAELVPGATP